MKKLLLTATLLTACGLSAFAQSKFTVGNSGTTAITFKDVGGALDGVKVQSIAAQGGDHFAALYLGAAGAPDAALVKSSADAKIGAVAAAAGLFSLGTVTIAGTDAGTSVQAQVRAWRASDPSINGRNESKTFVSKISPPVVLFGTGANQLNGFQIVVPEPTSMMLAGVGLSGLLFLRDRKSVV